MRRRTKLILSAFLAVTLLAGGLWARRDQLQSQQRELYLPELEREATQRPEDPLLLSLLATRYLEAHRPDQALVRLEQAAKTGKADDLLWRSWALTAGLAGNQGEQERILQEAAKDPRLAPAIKLARERLAKAPDQLPQALVPEGPTALATTYAAPGVLSWLRPQDGFSRREEAARATPNNPEAQRRWAEALLKNARPFDATPIVQQLMNQAPADPENRLLAAKLLEAQQQYPRALELYKALVESAPKNADAVLGLARSAIALRLPNLGMRAAQEAVKLLPQDPDAYIALGQAYTTQGLQWQKAYDALQKARQLAPERVDFYGPFYDPAQRTGHQAEAEALIRAYLKTTPDDGKAHYMLGIALLAGRTDATRQSEAEEHLRRATTLLPQAVAPRGRLGQLLLERQKPQDAVVILKEAEQLDPFSATIPSLLARAYQLLGNTAEAAQARETARKRAEYAKKRTELETQRRQNPTNKATLSQLKALYEAGGETQKADAVQRLIDSPTPLTSPDAAAESLFRP